MSTHTQTAEAVKKRKHGPVDPAAGEPSSKRSKTEKKEKKEKKKERKGKEKAREEKAREEEGEFRVFQATLALSIPPVFANNLQGGAEEMLDSMVMRYIPALRGVVLSHSHLQFLDSAATIKADCPFSNVTVGFEAAVWSPQIGMKLTGKVNLCSPDHVSLLVHRTFNVSIPRRHIPTDNWEFEYGPAENDPEFGAGAHDEGPGEEKNTESDPVIEGSGRWVHKITGSALGDVSGDLEFTVIGLTIANQMLSLVGSIQPDPFLIEEEYRLSTSALPTSQSRQGETVSPSDNGTVEAMLEDPLDESDEEPFETLSRKANEAIAESEKRRAKEADEAKAEKKRKRKEGKADHQNTGKGKKARS